MTNANQNQKTIDWLVLLYVAADDVPLNDLNEATLVDQCNRMLERLVSDSTIAPEVAVVALTDGNLRPDGERKYEYMTPAIRVHEEGAWREVPFDELDEETQLIFSIVDGKYEIDSGTPHTLAYFIRWALREYPANKVMLSIIGHGGGWSVRLPGDSLVFHPDVERAGHAGGGLFQPNKGTGNSPSLNGLCPDFTSNTALSTVELRDALVFGLNGRKLDVLFIDSCLMGMIEIAYELRNYARYLVAGEPLLWAQLPYDIYLDRKNLNSGIQPPELARRIVQLYNSTPNRVQKSWAISAVNLKHIDELQVQIERLAHQLLGLMQQDTNKTIEAIARAYYNTQQFDYNADLMVERTESYVDIFDFSAKLREQFENNDRSPSIQPNPAANPITRTANDIVAATSMKGRRFRTVINKPDEDGGGFRVIDNGHEIIPNQEPETILGSVGFDPSNTVISSFVQTDITPPNRREKEIIHVDDAYGLSIYFPMGEVVDPIDDSVLDQAKDKVGDAADDMVSIDDKVLQETLELRLQRYTSHLSFAKASPNWVALLKKLPLILDTNGDPAREALLNELKKLLLPADARVPADEALPADALVPADEAIPTDEVVRKISRQPTWRRRIFNRPRLRS